MRFSAVFEAWNGCTGPAICLRRHICQGSVAVSRIRISLNSTKTQVKSCYMSCAAFHAPPCSVSGPKYHKRQSKQNFEQVSWLTRSTGHGSTWSRDLAPQSYLYKTLLQFRRENNKTSIILCKSRFKLWIGRFSVIAYYKNPFQIFFNWEIETCDRYLHLITNRCIENEEDATNGYISRQLRIISIPT